VFSVWDDRRERKNASRRRRRGKVGTLKKHKGSTGELSMPYAPPGADSVLEVSVERGGNMCGRVRERGVFSVWDDRRERKNASRRRRRGKVGTQKNTRGRRVGSVNADGELSMPYAPLRSDGVLRRIGSSEACRDRRTRCAQ
jgi:hypothetical protein